MTDRPIIFSTPMVRALLDGRKTQTRRVLKPQPLVGENGFYHIYNAHGGIVGVREEDVGATAVDYVCYEPRDRLWVRENTIKTPAGIVYAADGEDHYGAGGKMKITPSIHMARWSSRLTLIVEGVKVERLQDISEEDARSEGAPRCVTDGEGKFYAFEEPDRGSHKCGFCGLWTSLYGLDAWDANPWVVALTFRVVKANIDAIELANRPTSEAIDD